MDRRSFVAGAAASAFGLTHQAKAQLIPPGMQQAGLTPAALPQIAALQQCPMWCWAASLEMLTRAAGKAIDQKVIVQSVWGSLVCVPSGIVQMVQAINRIYPGISGQPVQLSTSELYFLDAGLVPSPHQFNNSHIVKALSSNTPLLYGNAHHFMVLINVMYIPGPIQNIVQAVVLDPWPGAGGIHPLNLLELRPAHLGGQMHFLGLVDVT